MKKILSALCITTFLISISGCSGNGNSSAEYANSSVSQVGSAGSNISSSVEESADSDNKSLNGDERLSEKDGLLVYTDDLYTISADSTKWTIGNVENYDISFSYMGDGNDTATLAGVQTVGPIEEDMTVNMIGEQLADTLNSLDENYSVKQSKPIKAGDNDAYYIETEMVMSGITLITTQTVQLHGNNAYILHTIRATDASDEAKAALDTVASSFTFTE